MKKITSLQNPYIKELAQLQEKVKARRQSGTFLIEGLREVQLAVTAGYILQNILFVPEYLTQNGLAWLSGLDVQRIAVSPEVYQKLAYRGSTEGVLAVAESKNLALSGLNLTPNPLVLVAEAPEKPGNIGAMLRTADAAGIDAVIIANPKSDMYNPNIVRSSVGGLFTNQIATGDTDEIISFLKERNISIYCATLQDHAGYHEQDYTTASAIVVGTEDKGLSEAWRRASTQNIIIPMQGALDSMNVSVAAAVLIFEAKRQRGFK